MSVVIYEQPLKVTTYALNSAYGSVLLPLLPVPCELTVTCWLSPVSCHLFLSLYFSCFTDWHLNYPTKKGQFTKDNKSLCSSPKVPTPGSSLPFPSNYLHCPPGPVWTTRARTVSRRSSRRPGGWGGAVGRAAAGGSRGRPATPTPCPGWEQGGLGISRF